MNMSSCSQDLPVFDRTILLTNCGGDETLVGEIEGLLLEQLSVARRSLRVVARDERAGIAHALKGTARSCGALRLGELAARLEGEPETEENVASVTEAILSLEETLRADLACVTGAG